MSVDSKTELKDYKESIETIKKYPNEKRFTLAILQDIQRQYGFIPKEVMNYISEYLNLPISNIYSMSTFYKALSLKPKGKNVIKVCNGTACHIRGSVDILKEVIDILKINAGETTDDGLFSIEIVNCLGACALAPVIVINEKYYGSMTKEKIISVIEQYRRTSYEQC